MGPAGWLCIGEDLTSGIRAGGRAVSGNLTAAGNGVNWTVCTKMRRYARLANELSLQAVDSFGCYGSKLFLLQLPLDSSYTPHVPCNARWRDRSARERRRLGSPVGGLQAEGGKTLA